MSDPYANLKIIERIKMKQTIIEKDVTLAKIVAEAEKTIGRELTQMELAILQYGVEQIRLGLV